MDGKSKYLFGPVPSRRLGRSLGVDIVPLKTCTQNCIYCQLGIDAETTTERKPYVPIDAVIAELTERIETGLDADYITLSGSGEPTLNSQIGELIRQIKKITSIPVAVITNGTLLNDPAVRKDIIDADIVLPSLDADNEETFRKINCPHSDISLQSLTEGLCKFRRQYSGQIWLEVFLCEGVNTSDDQIARMKEIINRIKPDKIQLNNAVRPVVSSKDVRVNTKKLLKITHKLGENVEIIADFSRIIGPKDDECNSDSVFNMLKRRPCSIDDICAGLNISHSRAKEYIKTLLNKGLVREKNLSGLSFFETK